MAFCSHCGQKLPEGARFCPDCGAQVIPATETQQTARTAYSEPRAEEGRTRYAARQTAYSEPWEETAPQKSGDGRRGQLIGLVAVVAALVIAVVVMLVRSYVVNAETAETVTAEERTPTSVDESFSQKMQEMTEQEEAEPEPETANTPEEQPENASAVLFDGLLTEYQDIIDSVLAEVSANSASEWARQYNCGYMYDYDFDGYPELVALYSADGMQLHALLARRLADGTTRCLDQYVCDLAGGAKATIYSGVLANVPMLHIVYENYDGDMHIGRDTIIDLVNSDFSLGNNLTWEESIDGSYGTYYVDGAEDEAVFRMLFDSRSYWECSFPNDDCVPLADVVQEYLTTLGRGE